MNCVTVASSLADKMGLSSLDSNILLNLVEKINVNNLQDFYEDVIFDKDRVSKMSTIAPKDVYVYAKKYLDKQNETQVLKIMQEILKLQTPATIFVGSACIMLSKEVEPYLSNFKFEELEEELNNRLKTKFEPLLEHK